MSAASSDSRSPVPMPAWKRAILERKRAKLGSGPLPAPVPAPCSREPSPEPGVLQESLGPLHQNPFIRLEQERRRRRQHPRTPPSPGATSIQQLLELYSHVPGIRTIRAENIIIIESDQDYRLPRGAGHLEELLTRRGTSHPNPLEELLARRGSKVTEIRASEVVIYEPLSRSHEDLSALEVPTEPPGRVSRLRQRFNHGKHKPQRSISSDSLLESEAYPKLREAKPLASPKYPVASPAGDMLSQDGPGKGAHRAHEGDFQLSDDAQRLVFRDHVDRSVSTPAPEPSPPHSPSLTPSSPMSSPGSVTSYSPSSHFRSWSPDGVESAEEQAVSPSVPTFKERFENYTMLVNQPHSKLKDFSQKTGNNTITVNPRAVYSAKVKSSSDDEASPQEASTLTNGHASRSELDLVPKENINIQKLLSKIKQDNSLRTSEKSGPVLLPSSTSTNELPKASNTWRPKSEMDLIRSKFSSEPSATSSDTVTFNHSEECSTSATPNQQNRVSASTSNNSTFEIKPAPKPDLASIPDGDIKAKALANIRMQSKNSFVFIPKRKQESSLSAQHDPKENNSSQKPNQYDSASTFTGRQTDFTCPPRENGSQFCQDESTSLILEDRFDGKEAIKFSGNSLTQESTVPALSDFDWTSGLLSSTTESHSFTDRSAELEYFSSVNGDDDDDTEEPFGVPVTSIHDEESSKSELPITYIDDIVEDREAKSDSRLDDSFIPSYRPHTGPSEIQFKGGNTFTIVPKRKPVVSQYDPFVGVSRELEEEEEEQTGSKSRSRDGSEAPYTDLGRLLKKRYPTVDEIEVIGGYLSLKKSCLSKSASTGKKMKISFNESSLQTMFEYPSESSLAEDDQEEEDEDVSGSDEEEERPYSLFLPRPTFVSGSVSNNSLRPNSSNSGLSSYTPKHSVEFSKWQEKKYDEKPSMVGAAHQDCDHDRKNMLTPADSNSLSDFNSEPALYF